MSEAALPGPGNISEEGINMSGPNYVPQPAQNQSSQGEAKSSDSSGHLFNMYIKMTEKEDNKMADRWQKDADGILIFTGLFSAALAALLTVSVQDLKPNSQDISAFYLANIYQLLADPNATPAQPPPFSPSKSAIWVNSLWFLSLVIALTCAMLATLLQQWARRYVTITQPPRYSQGPDKRAQIRAFFAHGVNKLHLPWSVEALPTLLHLSLFLFFIGLAIYLFNINHTVFSTVLWWVVLTGGVYGCITLMPIFWPDSPYYAPLSSSAWFIHAGIPYAVYNILYFLKFRVYPYIPLPSGQFIYRYERRFHQGMTKSIQDTGSMLSVEMNSRILGWTIQALDEDKEVEEFFEAIPGFCHSDVVKEVQLIFDKVDSTLTSAFYKLLSRTLMSISTLQEDKIRRVMICAKATDVAHLSYSISTTLYCVFSWGNDLLRSVDSWQSLRNTTGGQVPGLCSQGILAGVVATVSEAERDERWEALAKDQLGEATFLKYQTHGDSVLLANLIHITRLHFRFYLEKDYKPCLPLVMLECISRFDVKNALPGLQHDFCALWNEITQEAHNRRFEDISSLILRPIRHLYIALHQGTDAAPTAFDDLTDDIDFVLYDPTSYPLCNIPDHHCDSSTGETTHPLTITSPLADPTDDILNPNVETAVSSLTEDYARIHVVGEPSLPDATETFQSSHPVNVETSHPAATSLDQITQGPTDITPTISPTSISEPDPHPAPAAPIFTPHRPFVPSFSNTLDPHDTADIGAVPDIPLSSLSSSGPVLGDTLPASSLPSPEFQIGQATAVPGPLLPSTSISLTQPQGTSDSHLHTALDDGTFDNDHRPDITIDPSLDTSNTPGDVDHPE